VTLMLHCDSLQVLEAIQQGIDKVNNEATSRAQRIQKWSILRRDFSMFGGELGQLVSTGYTVRFLAPARGISCEVRTPSQCGGVSELSAWIYIAHNR